MTEPIRVAVSGHRGRVGSVLAASLAGEPGITYFGGVGRGDDLGAFLHEKRPRAFIDFSQPNEALHNSLAAIASRASPVVGTTGPSGAYVDRLEPACHEQHVGRLVA